MDAGTITFREEVALAYFSACAPLGAEFTVRMKDVAKDLGYLSIRGVFDITLRLRTIGALTLVPTDEHWSRRGWKGTSWICHKRPEQFNIVPSRSVKIGPRESIVGICA